MPVWGSQGSKYPLGSQWGSEAALATAIDWARYAEVFAYDYNSGVLSLEVELAAVRTSTPRAE
jgi:hypothetical protein